MRSWIHIYRNVLTEVTNIYYDLEWYMGLRLHVPNFILRRYEQLLYRIGTTAEIPSLPSHFPEKLITEVFQGLVVLDCEYGEDRNYLESGGYSVILETEDDIQQLAKTLDIATRLPEWATWIDNTGYISALYIINDDFSIMVYLKSEIIPTLIRKELYEE